jgi:CheY-like chemotaxis protein
VLAKAVAVQPDLVLLDVLMPGLDGYAVCARIRADATLAAVPVIMVTGNYVLADVEAARRIGADDYLVKPFDPVVLLDKAKTLRMTTVAERGRPSGSKSGQLLTARGFSGVGVPQAVVVSPGCWTLMNIVLWSGVVMTPVISQPRGPTRKRRISRVAGSAASIWLLAMLS